MRDSRLTFDAVNALGLYYVVSGLWPVVHLRSFMALTGPKHDTWLVKTFGAFICGVGSVLLAARTPQERQQAARLGVLSAVTLATADGWYVARRRISPIYLVDALVELVLAATILRRRRS